MREVRRTGNLMTHYYKKQNTVTGSKPFFDSEINKFENGRE